VTFWPVRVLAAVTVTPGSGMLPDLTRPWMAPAGGAGVG